MSATERRQVPRTTLDKLAYIHIEPDNGGIVLNVSGEGLAFHSMAPVEKNGQLRFSLKEQNRRIDVCGELIWTDEIQKIGGLRFTTLTNEAREQIENWVSQAEELETTTSRLGAAFLRAFPNLKVRNLVPRIEASERLAPLKTKVRLRLSGFSGGLVTGLLASLLACLIFAFSYSHRQQFGESLIHLGERLTAKTPAQPSNPQPQQAMVPSPSAPVPQTVSTPPPAVSATQTHAAIDRASKKSESEFQDVVQIVPAAASPKRNSESGHDGELSSKQQANRMAQPVKPNAVTATNKPSVDPPAQHPVPPSAAEAASAAPTLATPTLFSTSAKPAISNAPALREPLGQVQAQSASSAPSMPLQRFFDLGKFKRQQAAQDLSDRVAQLGMRSSVVNKGHLWMSSYQVLVGPYLTQPEESKIHNDLVSNGIKARPFERGSRGFSFRSALTVGGSKLPVGELNITWETYVSEAKVNFVQGGSVLASANGSWVSHPQKFAYNEYVYENVGGNSRPLLEVHFAGLDRALVLR